MDNVILSTTLKDLISILITLVAAGTAIKTISTWINKPYKALDAKVEKHEERLEKHDKLFENDKQMIKLHEQTIQSALNTNKIMLKAQMAIINHMIDNNHVDGLKDVREELQNNLLDNNK